MVSSLADRPRFTEVFETSTFALSEPSVYVSGRSGEERSRHVEDLIGRCPTTRFIEVASNGDGTISISEEGDVSTASLRSPQALAALWQRYPVTPYLDITGISHPVWAALLRAALLAQRDIRVAYFEPQSYRFNRIRTEGELFDLSTRFEGIGPLPGFLSLAEPEEERVMLIPLLGFEGPRFSMVLNHVDVPRDRVIPIVGVPGFQPEFVFYAYQGNRLPLDESVSWMSVQYAAANCPFSAFYLLDKIARQYPEDFLRIAPIGTKPHGVGAVMFALANPDRAEIVYDHPVRREGRTSGAARLLVYHLYALQPYLEIT
jgi:hypothetical protein